VKCGIFTALSKLSFLRTFNFRKHCSVTYHVALWQNVSSRERWDICLMLDTHPTLHDDKWFAWVKSKATFAHFWWRRFALFIYFIVLGLLKFAKNGRNIWKGRKPPKYTKIGIYYPSWYYPSRSFHPSFLLSIHLPSHLHSSCKNIKFDIWSSHDFSET
jgi:hypothetical protein